MVSFRARNLEALVSSGGLSREEGSRLLEGFCPGVVVGPEATPGKAAFATAALLVELLARLHPKIALAGEPAAVRALDAVARRIDAALVIVPSGDASVGVGLSEGAAEASFYVGAAGTRAIVASSPWAVSPTAFPLAGQVAACLASWELFRLALARLGGRGAWGAPDFQLDLLSYQIHGLEDAIRPTPALPDPITIRDTYVIGGGALAHGLARGLLDLGNVRGNLSLVDNRDIKEDTAQRYACQLPGDTGKKVDVLANRLKSTGLNIHPIPKDYFTFLTDDQPVCDIDILVAAVDDRDLRAAMQAALPRVLINGWTGQGAMGMSVHRFLEEQPCLCCIYGKFDQHPSEEMQIHDSFGRAISPQRIRQMLHDNEPMGDRELAALRGRFAQEELERYRGKSIRAAYQGLVCSGTLVQLPAGQEVDVPVAFMSTLVGLLLTVELIKASLPTMEPFMLTGAVSMHVPQRPAHIFTTYPKKSDCICGDPDYRNVYREKWGVA